MRIISIRSPWWWFILHAGKDIENRDWPTKYRGPVLIHASKWFVRDEVLSDFDYARSRERIAQGRAAGSGLTMQQVTVGELRDGGGHIVGRANIVDCVGKSESPWFMGDYGFVLANAAPLAQPIPFKARLGLFEAPPEVLSAVTKQGRTAA